MKEAAVDVVHKFETDLYCDLTRDEVRERGESLAQTLENIRIEEEDLRDLSKQRKQKIVLLKERVKVLGDATRFHREKRVVEVEVVNLGNGMCNEIRKDTGEVIRTRKLSDSEMQMTVPKIGEKSVNTAAKS